MFVFSLKNDYNALPSSDKILFLFINFFAKKTNKYLQFFQSGTKRRLLNKSKADYIPDITRKRFFPKLI